MKLNSDANYPDPFDLELLTIAEVAKLLKVSKRTIQRMRDAEAIPDSLEVGERNVRWNRQHITDWIKKGCPKRK